MAAVLLAVIASAVLLGYVFRNYSLPAAREKVKDALAPLAVTPATGKDKYRADLQRTGDFGDQAIEDTPRVSWESRFVQPNVRDVSPVVSAGTVYFFTGLDNTELRGPGTADLIFDEDSMVTEQTVGLAALDAATGRKKWIYVLGEQSGMQPLPAVEVSGGTVFVPGLENGIMLALDAATGKKKWRTTFNDPATQTYHFINAPPTEVDGTLYYATTEPRLHAVDAASGAPRWTFPTGDWVEAAPAYSDGMLFFGTEGERKDPHLYAVEAASGTERWRFRTGGAVTSSPAVAGGTVFFGSNDRYFYAVDETTGQEKWRYQMGEPSRTSPAVSKGRVFVAILDRDNFGSVVALDAATGEEKWQVRSEQRYISSPVVAGKLVYVANQDGVLRAFDADTGREVWQLSVRGIGYHSPFFAGGVLYTGGSQITALEREP